MTVKAGHLSGGFRPVRLVNMSVTTVLFETLWDEYIFWSLVVGAVAFGWLYHHSFWFLSKSGEVESTENIDDLQVGVFPRHNDNIKLEVAWTILPFILIIYLTYISWAPLDAMWTSPVDGNHGGECEEGESSNNRILEGSRGIIQSDCYHIIDITAQQWFWSFDCLDLASEICDTDIESMEVYGSVPELFLKRGETYLANMTSLDVTHAPWFQHLGTKEDTVPGQYTQLWLPIPLEMTDESMILCAEYCGDAHSVMAGKLSIHD